MIADKVFIHEIKPSQQKFIKKQKNKQKKNDNNK